jgi:hypothetical protein
MAMEAQQRHEEEPARGPGEQRRQRPGQLERMPARHPRDDGAALVPVVQRGNESHAQA